MEGQKKQKRKNTNRWISKTIRQKDGTKEEKKKARKVEGWKEEKQGRREKGKRKKG